MTIVLAIFLSFSYFFVTTFCNVPKNRRIKQLSIYIWAFIVIGIALLWDGSYVRNFRLPSYNSAHIQDFVLFFVGSIAVSFLSKYEYGTKKENIIFVIFFPIIEEILFRGIVLMLLLESPFLTEKTAIFINGLLFGIMHIQYFGLSVNMLRNIIIAAIGGYYFAMITVDTGSIIPSIFLHIVFNFSAIIYAKYKQRSIT